LGIPTNLEIVEIKERAPSKTLAEKEQAKKDRKKQFKLDFPCYEHFGDPKDDRLCGDCEVRGTCEARTSRKQRGL